MADLVFFIAEVLIGVLGSLCNGWEIVYCLIGGYGGFSIICNWSR